MIHFVTKIWLFFAIAIFACSTNQRLAVAADLNGSVSSAVDQLCETFKKTGKPADVFGIAIQELSSDQVYAKWLEPSDYVKEIPKQDLIDLKGSIAYAKIKAPFFRVAYTLVAYDAESKYIPGIRATKVMERKRDSREKEYVLIERDRDVPIALKPFVLNGSKYKIENTIYRQENKWVVVRVKLASSEKKSEKSMMKLIEGFELATDLGNGEVFVMSGGFALPNLGFLNIGKPNQAGKIAAPLKAPLNKVTFGILDKVGEKLDIGTQIQRAISDSIVEGTFQNIAALTQVTTDERWKSKWAYQLSKNETKELAQDNKELLEQAKKNKQILYKLTK